MSKISVIIPVYNTEEFLEQCIQTVLDQTYQDLEIIIINDNSDLSCTQKIDKMKELDERIKVFPFTETKGVGAARNFGIKQANGDYIYFLDSDDYLPANTLELLVENINEHDMISGKIKKTHLSEISDEEEQDQRDDQSDLEDDIDENDDMEIENELDVRIYTKKKFNLIKNKSVLNRLFKKEYIERYDLHFSENIERYSDLVFIVPALLNTEEIPYLKNCLYYKRKRNDPISNPALMQGPAEERIGDFLKIYIHLKDTYKDEAVSNFLDRQLLNYYRKPIVRFFRKNENVDKIYYLLRESMKRVDRSILRKRSRMIRKEIKYIRKGNIQKFKKVNLMHHRKRKIKRALKGRTKLYIQLYRAVFLKLPMKEDTVVFESFLGKSYSDSPKYIYQYMINNKMNYKYVWIFNEKKKIPGNAIQIKRFSLRYYYYLARAKYWVSNSRMPKTLNKRDGNIYLQTWHGTPLKTLVFDMKDIYSADPRYKKNFYKQSRRWDYLSSPNAYSSKIFRRAFKHENEMLEFGYPRNDILYQKNTKKDIDQLKRKLKIPKDKKVVLYAPTWRDDEFLSRGKYKFTLKLELDRLQKELGKEYIVLLRTHYFIADNLDVSDYKGFVYDFSRYEDIAELYLVSDILITDYSSVFFDYANLKRPILFYTYDLEKYRDKLRGFYIDIEKEVPGPLLMDTEEVIHAIKNIDELNQAFAEKYDQFYERFCKWDDGYASENTVKAVFGEDLGK